MSAHVLACALYCNSDGSLNGLGTAVAWVIGVPLCIGLLGAVARFLNGPSGGRRGR